MGGCVAELLRHVSSANIACGGHAGDPNTMRTTVRLCKSLGVAVGAHPGYADKDGFGRRAIAMSADEIPNRVVAQIGALFAIDHAEGVALRHVKPHGALCTAACSTRIVADAIAKAVACFDKNLRFVGLAGSELVRAGESAGLLVLPEAYGDRRTIQLERCAHAH